VLTGTFSDKYNVVQVVRSTFDIHVGDIIGTLIVGGTLVMLHPKGNIDFEYLSEVIRSKQITYMHTIPTLLHSFFTFLKDSDNISAIESLVSLCGIGE